MTKTAKRRETKNTPFHQSWTGGVRIESALPHTAREKVDPIVFIHGGCHGSQAFQNYLSFFAESGWESHALNWFYHARENNLPARICFRRNDDNNNGDKRYAGEMRCFLIRAKKWGR